MVLMKFYTVSVKLILHYALGLCFGKVCDQKHEQKRNWLAFLLDAWYNIETFSRVGLVFF